MEIKKNHLALLLGILLICSVIVYAEDNTSTEVNTTTSENLSQNMTETPANISNETEAIEEGILTENVSNVTQPSQEIIDVMVAGIVPQEFKIGDTQFNIRVKNIGNVEIKNLMAIVSGKGFSTYDVVALDALKPEEVSYIIVMGSFRERGNITLTIRLLNKFFTQNASVIDPDYVDDQQKLKDLQAKEEEIKKIIESLSAQLTVLENDYAKLDNEFSAKKNKKYDLSEVNLNDLKDFLRDAQAGIVVGDIAKTKSSLTLASEEYHYQKGKLDNATLIKTSFFNKIRNNLILISSVAASIITLFALLEILKRKKESLSKKVMEVKVTFEKKKKEKAGQETPKEKKKKEKPKSKKRKKKNS